MSEIQLQAKIFQYVWNQYPATRGLFFHVPNGGYRSKIEASQMKASGVIAGIPDLIFMHNGQTYGFELKTEDGKVSPVQERIHKTWRDNNTPVFVIRSLEQFLEVFLQIYSPNQKAM